MVHLVANKDDSGANKLGINRGVYATGNSIKDGTIAFVAITAAALGAIVYGRKSNPELFARIAEKASSAEKLWEKHGDHAVVKFLKNIKEKLSGKDVALAISIGYIASHIAMIPSAAAGWRKAQKAVDKYDRISDERDQLVDANARLIAENKQGNVTVAEAQIPSHVERLQAQADTAPGITR